MRKFLIELDEKTATDLERVAPATKRQRAAFVRHAIDIALDRATEEAYRADPFRTLEGSGDLEGWDVRNELATSPRARRSRKNARSAVATGSLGRASRTSTRCAPSLARP